MQYNFDRVADRYDATRGLPPGVAERICRWVLSRLPADPAVAEVGVGTGRIAIPFIQQGVRFTGFDISEQMLSRLTEKLSGDLCRARLLLADITHELPVPEHSQHCVIGVHIFHLVDTVAAMQQIRRILAPHGALVWGYNMYDEFAPHGRMGPKYHQFSQALGGPGKRDYRKQEARDLLHQWGARVTQHVVTAWTETETPAGALERIRTRVMSSTWDVPDAIHEVAVRQTEAWVRAEYGDLQRPYEYDVRFMTDWYQF
ncbi:MAG TPA: class I SAM-dependent methyltransferase [Symbiobacteriaceae bacterium]|nr:class I SAM-dependent methyltransferase [Symbiobacteriaceae bacterium]